MASTVTLRLVVHDPVPGVALAVQRGKGDLVPPVSSSKETVIFEISIEATTTGGRVILRGKEIQGPAAGRFIYINAGTYAGQQGTAYGRRAKVPLGALDAVLIDAALRRPGRVLVADLAGRARDGGPAAASQQLLGKGWYLADAGA